MFGIAMPADFVGIIQFFKEYKDPIILGLILSNLIALAIITPRLRKTVNAATHALKVAETSFEGGINKAINELAPKLDAPIKAAVNNAVGEMQKQFKSSLKESVDTAVDEAVDGLSKRIQAPIRQAFSD